MNNRFSPHFHYFNRFLYVFILLFLLAATMGFAQDETNIKWFAASVQEGAKVLDLKPFSKAIQFNDDYHMILRLSDIEARNLKNKGSNIREIFNLDTIRLNGTTIDTTQKTDSIIKPDFIDSEKLKSKAAADGRRQLIVQFWGPPQNGWVESLVSAGADLVIPVPPYSWIVLANSSAEKAISGLAFVRWIGEVHPAHRVDRSVYLEIDPATQLYHESYFLPKQREHKDKSQCQITLLGNFFPNVADSGKWLENQEVNADKIHIWGHNWLAYANLSAKDVERLSCQPEILNISLDMKPVLMDERSCQIVADNTILDEPYVGYRDWLDTIGLDGSGVAVGVMDTRCQDDPYHFGTRLKSICGCDGNFDSTPLGDHGTHVCGIVGGGETCSYFFGGFCKGLGVAPECRIMNIWGMVVDEVCGIIDCHTRYLTEPAPDGLMCSVSNNSWGFKDPQYPRVYSDTDAGWDEISFDYDMNPGNGMDPTIIVFAAGNEGSSGLTSPQGAKNPILVGACSRANPNEITDFSAWSLLEDGRRRPDVAAPGHYIYSAWPCEGIQCDEDPDLYRHNSISGTSMAAPHVSGALALFTQWWQGKKGGNPTMALCRAALIASADDMVGGKLDMPAWPPTLGHRPDEHQGWGRLNIKRLLEEREDHIFVDSEVTLTNAGKDYYYLFYPRHTDRELRIALCWTDPPGAGGANPALVNNLDLSVEAGDYTYIGNNFDEGFSADDDTASHDMIDNVECVFIHYPIAGVEYKVHVKAASLLGDGNPDNPDLTDQTFALVILNGDAIGDPVGKVRFEHAY